MERNEKLYFWKDVERFINQRYGMWKNTIGNIEVYDADIIVHTENELSAQNILSDMLGERYNTDTHTLTLDMDNKGMKVYIEESDEKRNESILPLFKRVLYSDTAYRMEMFHEKLPGVPVLAFGSYKGGVGRTLSLLSFVKAWSELFAGKEREKVLVIDADLEAPGLTWLSDSNLVHSFSYLDLISLIQENDNIEDISDIAKEMMEGSALHIETDVSVVDQPFLPVYRYKEQMLDMYSSPETIVEGYKKEYILSEVLSLLGKKIGASMVFVDLRAGLSEFSAPLLFDPRVKKYLVTSTSYQSVMGTKMILEQLTKGMKIEADTLVPEIFLNMESEGFSSNDRDVIISELSKYYENCNIEVGLTDHVITECTFASELVHLGTLDSIMKLLSGRKYYQQIYEVVKTNYVEEQQNNEIVEEERIKFLKKVHDMAQQQISAEANNSFRVLMTSSIQNLLKKFSKEVPQTVIMGAKGAGKTFLYRELIRSKTWSGFCKSVGAIDYKKKQYIIPLIATGNSRDLIDDIKKDISYFNEQIQEVNVPETIFQDNSVLLSRFNQMKHDKVEWISFWEKLILQSFQIPDFSLEKLQQILMQHDERIIFIVDGIEEILVNTVKNESEQIAVATLCQDVVNIMNAKYSSIGLIVFMRKDLARDAIKVNFTQFEHVYSPFELKWSGMEALRLALWLVNEADSSFYKEGVAIEKASRDVVENALNRLWGVKLGKPDSNEAYSSRWILAALSDFNGQLQARDIIRFLQFATENVGKQIYFDRYIMPTEIKRAVPSCSSKKLEDIRLEIGALKPILDALDQASYEKKILPFSNDTFHLTTEEEKKMKQEGYLVVDNEKYYLPEILRHALGFRYERGARPKVLSLLKHN